ncbi:MAG: tripartite tricarboxylate transporter permease [Hyphomicrobiales bacterium]|nr:MAG: tripartite tricarboxylate transporter permease [Hyphomicrobiales bacterium]
MPDIIANLSLGLSVAVSPENLLYCLIGVFIGTLIGVLPGLGTSATLAMLLPFTFGLPPAGALIMLAGIYYGAQYGGSTTSILLRIPGEASAVMTAIDGHEMAKLGRAGAALAIAAISSFIAGTLATLLVGLIAMPLVGVALAFGSVEYFALMVFGVVLSISLSNGSVLKSLAMVSLGLLLSTVGSDIETAQHRLTFGMLEFSDGLEVVVIAMGLFGFAEVMRNVGAEEQRALVTKKISGLWLTGKEFMQSVPAIARGFGIGSLLGILPGAGAIMSSFTAYALEKRVAKNPERFGKGAIEGVAAPEAANNAAAQTGFVTLLALGIPGNIIMALMMGAMIMQGIQPGPRVMVEQPGLFWGLIVSMWIGNIMLLVLNLPLVGMWVKLLSVPYRLMFPAIVVFAAVGTYSISGSPLDVIMAAVFGLVGYFLVMHRFELPALMLGFVLGPLLENNLRRSLLIARGDLTVFATHPISAVMLSLSAVLVLLAVVPALRKRKEEVLKEA